MKISRCAALKVTNPIRERLMEDVSACHGKRSKDFTRVSGCHGKRSQDLALVSACHGKRSIFFRDKLKNSDFLEETMIDVD